MKAVLMAALVFGLGLGSIYLFRHHYRGEQGTVAGNGEAQGGQPPVAPTPAKSAKPESTETMTADGKSSVLKLVANSWIAVPLGDSKSRVDFTAAEPFKIRLSRRNGSKVTVFFHPEKNMCLQENGQPLPAEDWLENVLAEFSGVNDASEPVNVVLNRRTVQEVTPALETVATATTNEPPLPAP